MLKYFDWILKLYAYKIKLRYWVSNLIVNLIGSKLNIKKHTIPCKINCTLVVSGVFEMSQIQTFSYMKT